MTAVGAGAALDHVSTSTFHGAPARPEGLLATATDPGWTRGPQDGSTLQGRTADLLSAAGGRPAGLDGSHGDGVATLRSRPGVSGPTVAGGSDHRPGGDGDGRQ